MVSLWLPGGFSGALSTCVSLVNGFSMPLIVGACNSSFSTLLADCGVLPTAMGLDAVCTVPCLSLESLQTL